MQRRLFLAVAIIATAVLGTTASPAAAHGTSHAKAAQAVYDCSNFDAFASLTANSALLPRGDDVIKEPTLNEVTAALPDSAKGKAGKNWKTVTVLVWFHVVSDGATGNVTQRQVDDQIRIMNSATRASTAAPTRLPLQARRRDADGQRRVVQRRPGLAGRAGDEEGAAPG